MMRGTRDRAGKLNPNVMRNNILRLTNPKARRTRIRLLYLARHWPGGDRLRRPPAKGVTAAQALPAHFASCAVPMALRLDRQARR